MSNDRFDVLERYEPMFEAPEASFEGFVRRRDRKRRNQRIAAGVVGIAVFAGAVLLAASSPSDRGRTPASPGPTVPAVRDAVGFIGLPLEGAAPSTPERGKLVLSFRGASRSVADFQIYVYADGRLIWQQQADLPFGANPYSTGLLEQRLTQEGIGLIRAEITRTGLFGHDLDLAGQRFQALTPGSVLDLLIDRLGDPVAWLPASAWADQDLTAYIPSRFRVCHEGQQAEIDRILRDVPSDADLLRLALGDAACSDISTDQASTLGEQIRINDALERSPATDVQSDGAYRLRYESGSVSIWLQPYLPHGVVACPCPG